VRNPFVQPLNPLGPPSRCRGAGFLWVADSGDRRISVFDFDYEPYDVWVVGDSIYVMGLLGNTVRQYTLSGGLVRSTPSLNGGHFAVAAWGSNLWSTYGDKGSSTVV
jgi:hypothetical protein